MRRIKVAIALSKEYFAPGGVMYDMPLGRFLLNEFSKNPRIDATFHFHSREDVVDVHDFFGYDAVVNTYIRRKRSALHIDRFDKFKGVKCCVSVEPHNITQQWENAYHQDGYSFVWYHYPVECIKRRCKSNIDYRRIVPGINKALYKSKDFKSRIQNKILLTGSEGGKGGRRFYILRKICKEHPDVVYSVRRRFFGSNYPTILQKYKATIAACTEYTVIKYIETAACGCLVFMEGTKLNAWKSLGFTDGYNAIRIDQNNYQQKFEEFLNTSNDPRWEIIASRGRKFAFDTFDTNIQTNLLVDYIEEYL